MFGNGLANIVAALIIAGALVWTEGRGGKSDGASEEDYAEWYARAAGDIRNDIVVNCGCCGEGPRRAGKESF